MDNRKRKARVWTFEVKFTQEDLILENLVENIHGKAWSKVSSALFENFGIKRSAKQCRNRWVNKGNKENTSLIWTEKEIDLLFDMQSKFGCHWAYIAQELKSKTENQIKNQFYSTINRNVRKYNKCKQDHERIFVRSLEILKNYEIKNILLLKKEVKKVYFQNLTLSEEAMNIIRSQNYVNKKVKRIKNDEIKNYESLTNTELSQDNLDDFDEDLYLNN